MDDVRSYFSGLQHDSFLAAVTTNKNIKVGSFNMFKSSENIQMKEGGPDCTVLNDDLSSVTLDGLAIKARENIL